MCTSACFILCADARTNVTALISVWALRWCAHNASSARSLHTPCWIDDGTTTVVGDRAHEQRDSARNHLETARPAHSGIRQTQAVGVSKRRRERVAPLRQWLGMYR